MKGRIEHNLDISAWDFQPCAPTGLRPLHEDAQLSTRLRTEAELIDAVHGWHRFQS